ncbi:Tn3 family transposase [Spirosoma foliorum]|uniref:Tn3 family transposase n=1 Tax=Spirosoma foliorum TaxID=2710596 RepID=A0A7G5H6Z6_9BACT|nr:Tn3 family transposase [Spirosoma foliorum]
MTLFVINCIICYNYLHLSDHLSRPTDRDERRKFIQRLSKLSVLTHHHINFNGIYDFVDGIDLAVFPFGLPGIESLEL